MAYSMATASDDMTGDREAVFDEGAEAQPERPALEILQEYAEAINIADSLESSDLGQIGMRCVREFGIDEQSLKDEGYDKRCKEAMDLALQVKTEKTYPWPSAANIKYPLIATAAMQFAARAYPAIVNGWNVVKGKVLGPDPEGQKQERADRIAAHMSYQFMEEMEEWEEQTDQLLHILPIVGNVFRKTYFDPIKGRNVSEIILPSKFVVNYWAKPLGVCPRTTQICEYYPHEVETKFAAGIWRKVELGMPEGGGDDEQAPHTFLEQHCLLDLDDDGYSEPYIVTVHKETQAVVRIVARYDVDGIKTNAQGDIVCIEPVPYYTKFSFIPSFDGSFYDIGFGTLLNALNETINSTMNQLMDAGHLSNVQGGFIGSGVSMKSGAMRFQPGEWKRVEVTGADLRASVVPLPVAQPSSVLFQLLGMLIDAAKDVTATKDILTGDVGSTQAVGTTLAAIEQGLKVFTAIYKRIHRALKHEFKTVYRLNRVYLEPDVYFNFQDDQQSVAQADYAANDVDVIPVSDPTTVTDMQKMSRAEFMMGFKDDPMMNRKEIIERALDAALIPDKDKLFAKEAGPDPASVAIAMEAKSKAADLDLAHQRLELDREEAITKRIAAEAKAALDHANAQKAMAELAIMGPEFAAHVAAMAQEAVAQALAQAQADIEGADDDAGQPDVQSGDMVPMDGPPSDQDLPAISEGPPDDLGQGMDGGGKLEPGIPDEGPVDGGIGEPELQ